MKIRGLVMGVALLTWPLVGCNQMRKTMFPDSADTRTPQANTAGICRATPIWVKQEIKTDDVDLFTGQTSGEDGVNEVAYACKCLAGENIVACESRLAVPDATCPSFASSGAASDGTMAIFSTGHVHIQLGKTNGYSISYVREDFSCHG